MLLHVDWKQHLITKFIKDYYYLLLRLLLRNKQKFPLIPFIFSHITYNLIIINASFSLTFKYSCMILTDDKKDKHIKIATNVFNEFKGVNFGEPY